MYIVFVVKRKMNKPSQILTIFAFIHIFFFVSSDEKYKRRLRKGREDHVKEEEEALKTRGRCLRWIHLEGNGHKL